MVQVGVMSQDRDRLKAGGQVMGAEKANALATLRHSASVGVSPASHPLASRFTSRSTLLSRGRQVRRMASLLAADRVVMAGRSGMASGDGEGRWTP
jgi:hypothetical protein